MIDLYSWATPNGHKIHIMLELLGVEYRVHPIDIGKGDQFKPEFLQISPNNKIPAIVDSDGPGGKALNLFESGAILIYLAEKYGKYIPTDPFLKYKTIEWLMFQMAGFGPMLGQAHHFRIYAPEKVEYAINRYTNEAKRLYGVLDKQLSTNDYVVGKELTIADIAIYPWSRSYTNQGIDIDQYPNFKRWFTHCNTIPAFVKGCEVLTNLRDNTPLTDKQREVLYGKTQYERK